MDDSSTPLAAPAPADVSAPTLRSSVDPHPGDPASTGVMKALKLVDILREERRRDDDHRLSTLMRRAPRES